MEKRERGAVSVLVLLTVFCFTTILTGAYVAVMVSAKSQQKSNLKIQHEYGDNLNEIESIYEQIQANKETLDIIYNPDGEEQSYTEAKLQTVLSIANLDDENVSIYYSWNESNVEEPTTWEECQNGENIEKENAEPGSYYLWTKVYDKNENKTLKTKVSEEFVIKEEENNEDITYNWKKEYEWGNGTETDLKYYKILIYITNHGQTVENWEINFDVQPGIVLQSCNVWSASSTEANGNTVTMKCQSWNGKIEEGNTLTVDFILAFDNAQELSIDNFKFNGKIIQKQ